MKKMLRKIDVKRIANGCTPGDPIGDAILGIIEYYENEFLKEREKRRTVASSNYRLAQVVKNVRWEIKDTQRQCARKAEMDDFILSQKMTENEFTVALVGFYSETCRYIEKMMKIRHTWKFRNKGERAEHIEFIRDFYPKPRYLLIT